MTERERKRATAEEKQRREEVEERFDAIIRAADEAGLTYGQYVAVRERGMTPPKPIFLKNR